MELGILYELVGPSGARIAFGNSDVARADPDWIGWLDPDSGISGLDSPDVRESAADRAGGHGGIHYDFLHGRRPIVIAGTIEPTLWTPALEDKILDVTNAMRPAAPALLKWTNTGIVKRRLSLLRQQPPRITGRRPKGFQLAMVDADYRKLADAEANVAATARGVAAAANNVGNELATPRIELSGAFGGPIVLRNLGTGLNLTFKAAFSVAAGQLLVVDLAPPYPTVKFDGADVSGQVDFLNTSWWGLVPGSQNVRVDAASGAGTWRIYWRSAWI